MKYYVNANAQSNGDHEVHREGCSWITLLSNMKYLGDYPSCQPAVKRAKEIYSKADGCKYCCPQCHTS